MINDPELLRFLRNEAIRATDEKLNRQRAAALDFYHGEPFGDEEDGRSQLVTRDVAEVVDYMTVSILRTMVSGDRIVEFEARDEAHRQAADDATALVQHDLMRRQRGYQLVHDFLKAGLLEKSGIVKSWVEHPVEQVAMDVAADAVIGFEDDTIALIDGTAVLSAEPFDGDGLSPMMRVTVEREAVPVFRDMAVANEEFLVSPDARTLDDAVYLAHKTLKPLSDLVALGHDEADVVTLWDDGAPATPVSDARDRGRDETSAPRTDLSRQVWLYEEYPLIAGRRSMVHRVGSHVLSAEPVDEQPFEMWTPFPMPHRLIGQSLADKVMDVQRVRSVLLRQAADNLYQSNSPRVLVSEDGLSPSTIDDLLTVRPGALIRYTGARPPEPFAVPFTAGNAFQAMEMMSGEKEARTGITRLNQGLDADTLNKTATGTALMQAQGQQIEEYLARNFAEAMARVLDRKRRLMKRHARVQTIQVDGKFREIDPSQWPDEMECLIRVGLGTGRKDVRLQYRQMILQLQQAAKQDDAPLVTWKNIHASLSGIVADTGLGSVADYFSDPPEQEGEEQRPDPETMKAHASAMLDGEKLKGEQRLSEARIMLQARESEAKVQATRDDAALRLELAREEAAEKAQLARDRADEEGWLAMQKLAMEERIALARISMERELAEQRVTVPNGSGLGGYRPGGDLSE